MLAMFIAADGAEPLAISGGFYDAAAAAYL